MGWHWTWVASLTSSPSNIVWKLLLLDILFNGGDKVWLLIQVEIENISTKFIPF
jgi:hypothetical protein